MNIPPKEAVRVPAEALRKLVSECFQKVDMPAEDARLLAELLVLNDLRGVFSHGTQQMGSYIGKIQKGLINPRPNVRIVSESPTTLNIDGDGGLGYFPAYQAARAVIDKAKAQGVAMALTRYHGHIGAAGLYTRIPLSRDLVTFCLSGYELRLSPQLDFLAAAGGSPMSFAVPAGEEPPLTVDIGTMHDLYKGSPYVEELIHKTPGLVFRCIGLGSVCQALGGLLCGASTNRDPGFRKFAEADEGGLLWSFDISRFMPVEDFKREMDSYAREVRKLQPLSGFDRACLAGTLEWEREREWSVIGVPVGQQHRARLQRVADELGAAVPF
ncbi:MAG: Ldh family oxidoreductase [Armatimonadetes bacterium]|nr:Ldh family oxidoreductase [Armatimonadota bacterium]